MPDVNGLGDKIVSSVRGFVARSLEALEARIATVEEQLAAKIDVVALQTAKRLAALEDRPAPVDGKDGKSVSLDMAIAAIGPACQDWTADRFDAWRTGADAAWKKILGEALAAIPAPVNGKDGAPGADGRSVSLDEIEAIVERRLELKFAAYVVEHERRLPDVLQRMIDGIEKPRDGINGKDGRDGKDGKDGEDGFDLRHFNVEQVDERTVIFRLKDLTREKKHTLVFPVPIQRGIWNAEKSYARGDIVTWGGSQFEKLTDEPGGKPEEGTTWRMVVKRGRDGKDGVKGDKGDPGKAGRNGRDLTQMGSDGSKW